MQKKVFSKLDEGFTCLYCGKEVGTLNYTSRDHCPYCLHSIHVDINPGDRENDCLGDMQPIGIEKFRDTYKIIYQCVKCGMLHKNVMANDDDFNKVIELSVR